MTNVLFYSVVNKQQNLRSDAQISVLFFFYDANEQLKPQISSKVAMVSRRRGFVGSLSSSEQQEHCFIMTCQCQSAALPAHEWIVYRLSLLLRSVGHRLKTHRITPAADNERGDIEIQDYVFLSHGEDDRLPPRTLVMDVTMTHDRYGRTTQHTNGALTHRVSSTGAPHPDGVLNKAARMKIRYYRQIYADRPDPIVFLPITVSTSGRVYEDLARLLFLHAHREASILDGELPEESEQFGFLRASRLANLSSQSLCNASYYSHRFKLGVLIY